MAWGWQDSSLSSSLSNSQVTYERFNVGVVVIHYSCDRCQRSIDSRDEFRYIVRMEVKAALDAGVADESDADRDHLMEIHEILELAEDLENDLVDEDVYKQLRYDFCPECYREFLKNPMAREKPVECNFSKN